MNRLDPRRPHRTAAGLAAAAGGLVAIGSSFLGWISTPMETGGRTTISGWGRISGGDELVDGVDLNVLMEGEGSYRPGVWAAVIGLVIIVPALVLAATGDGRRPNRMLLGLLLLCGVGALGYGGWRAVDPGDALGVLPAGYAATGGGPILLAVAGLVVAAVAVWGLVGGLDPLPPPVRRGIQPRR